MRKLLSTLTLLLIIPGFLFAGEIYIADPAHTSIEFSVSHMMMSNVKGRFKKFDIELNFDPNKIENSQVKVTIDVNSIDTGNEKRDTHLKSPDFFDAKQFPTITFVSRSIRKKRGQWHISGDLTIRGVTRRISFPFELRGPMKDPMGFMRMAVLATLEINRFDFNVKWSKKMDNGGLVVGDKIKVEINAEFVRPVNKK